MPRMNLLIASIARLIPERIALTTPLQADVTPDLMLLNALFTLLAIELTTEPTLLDIEFQMLEMVFFTALKMLDAEDLMAFHPDTTLFFKLLTNVCPAEDI